MKLRTRRSARLQAHAATLPLTTPVKAKKAKKATTISSSADDMTNCPHLLSFHWNKCAPKLTDPTAWACTTCSTTDGVWLCLTCGNVGCGRDNYAHARRHFEQTNHAVVFEFNTQMCHCKPSPLSLSLSPR